MNRLLSKRPFLILPVLGFLVVWLLVLLQVTDGHSSDNTEEVLGHLSGLLAVGALTGLLLGLGLSVKGLVVGKDNRVSTSKVQALVWTYAIAAALVSLIVAKWAGAADGYDALTKHGVQEEYLILLGGPFAAAILAKGIVTSKVASGQVAKTEGQPHPKQIFSGDDGNTDLVDTQYVFFNLVALIFFVGTFIAEAEKGLPTISPTLIALTGVAAATYVSNKAVLNEAPSLIRLVPSRGPATTPVTVYGKGLRLPKLEDGNTIYEEPQVTFDDRPGDVDAAASRSTVSGEDRVQVKVPTISELQAEKAVEVEAINARGTASNKLTFTVEPSTPPPPAAG
jgi:hypothetical protein